MFLLIGTKTTRSLMGVSKGYMCNACDVSDYSMTVKIKSVVTLFFIPLIGPSTYRKQCLSCSNTTKVNKYIAKNTEFLDSDIGYDAIWEQALWRGRVQTFITWQNSDKTAKDVKKLMRWMLVANNKTFVGNLMIHDDLKIQIGGSIMRELQDGSLENYVRQLGDTTNKVR